MAHLVSLVCHGIFERLPTLRGGPTRGRNRLAPRGSSGGWTRTGGPFEARPLGSTACRAKSPASTSASRRSRSSTPTAETRLLFEMLEAVGAPDNASVRVRLPALGFRRSRFHARRLPEAWRDRCLHENAVELYGERLAPGTRREHLGRSRLLRRSRAARPLDRPCRRTRDRGRLGRGAAPPAPFETAVRITVDPSVSGPHPRPRRGEPGGYVLTGVRVSAVPGTGGSSTSDRALPRRRSIRVAVYPAKAEGGRVLVDI